jgi:hypothetical protein
VSTVSGTGSAGVFATLGEAEHWIDSLEPAPEMACTHLIRSPRPHLAVTLGAAAGGRAVRYPGVARMAGTLPVAEVLALSAIDRVEILGGGQAPPEALLDTRDFVRPLWRDGELVLTAMPAAGDRLVPFETPNPTPCCAAH